MSDPIHVNGNQHSWGSINVKAYGEVFTGFNKISYADKRERTKAYGMGRHHAPRGRSAGKYSTENVKIGGPIASMQALREGLARLAPDKVSYGNVVFEVVVQYVEADEIPIHVVIERCVYVGTSTSNEENADTLSEDAELDCMLIRRNGLTLFDSTKGSP